jgi:hypothetical protein
MNSSVQVFRLHHLSCCEDRAHVACALFSNWERSFPKQRKKIRNPIPNLGEYIIPNSSPWFSVSKPPPKFAVSWEVKILLWLHLETNNSKAIKAIASSTVLAVSTHICNHARYVEVVREITGQLKRATFFIFLNQITEDPCRFFSKKFRPSASSVRFCWKHRKLRLFNCVVCVSERCTSSHSPFDEFQ